jgi:hypothetical protein
LHDSKIKGKLLSQGILYFLKSGIETWMLLIFFSGLSGNFDGEGAVLLLNAFSSFFGELSVLNFVHSDNQC